MKLKTLTIFVTILFTTATIAAFSQGSQAKLPDSATAYIQQNFPNERVISSRLDDGEHYDVYLSGGYELEFSRQGEIREVEGKTQAIPQRVVPSNILGYVRSQHSGQDIRKLDKESYGYEVTLLNGMELEFDRNGRFLRIDEPVPSQ